MKIIFNSTSSEPIWIRLQRFENVPKITLERKFEKRKWQSKRLVHSNLDDSLVCFIVAELLLPAQCRCAQPERVCKSFRLENILHTFLQSIWVISAQPFSGKNIPFRIKHWAESINSPRACALHTMCIQYVWIAFDRREGEAGGERGREWARASK